MAINRFLSGFVQAGVAALLGLALLGPTAGATDAATLIAVRDDGSASVRVEDGDPIIIPAGCVSALGQRLPGLTDPTSIREVLAAVVAEYAPTDGLLAGAIAAYGLTLVPRELGGAVVAGAQQGNPEASQAIMVPAGPAPQAEGVSGLTNLSSVGGVGGGGTQELRRSASEIE